MTLFFQRDEPKGLRNRVPFVIMLLIATFMLLLFRFWYLQVFKGKEFRELSENNRIRLFRINPIRGIIYDRNGEVLVENRPVFVLKVVPEDVKDWTNLIANLSQIVEIDDEEVQARLSKAKKRPRFEPVVLKSDLTWEEIAKVETFKMELPGVTLDVVPRRFYPQGRFASHILGYLGELNISELRDINYSDYSQGEVVGKYGIEELKESYLRGSKGGQQVEVDALGRVKKVLYELEPTSGKDVYLTIDKELQKVAEDALEGKAGTVIALDPQTGKVLALASSPSYNPNHFVNRMSLQEWSHLKSDARRPLENKAIQGQYPPASTFKPIVAAAALEEKTLNPYTEIYAGGSFKLGNRNFRDWKEGGHGFITVHEAIVESSDTFFYQVGLNLGVDKIAEYAANFGFGKKSGISLNDEKEGLVPSKSWKRRAIGERWVDGETLTIAIGQGYFLATPLQVVNAFSAIANGGRLLVPQIVERIEDDNGAVYEPYVTREINRLSISEGNLEVLRKALLGVVEESEGTGRTARIRGIKVAGKTGTAQVVELREDKTTREDEKIPYKLRDHSWFVGFAPYKKPEIAVVAFIEHGGYGAVSAAPIARSMLQAYFSLNLDEQ
jgi:penicillin-binding protein 2